MIAEKDKKTLLFLFIIVILVGAYFLAGKFQEDNLAYEEQVKELKAKHSDLNDKNIKQDDNKLEILDNGNKLENILAGYRNSLSQEETLLFLTTVEKNTGVWFKQQSIESASQIYYFGNVTSSNPTRYGQRVYSSDYVGISTNTNVAYECTYKQLKTLIQYLNENAKKAKINSMSYTYDASTDVVSGTMSITLYAITGGDRPAQDVEIKDVSVGTGNIFNSDLFVPVGSEDSYRDKILTSYDLYLIVNRTGADKDAVICGQSGDPTNQTVVSTNSSGPQNVTIKITGRAGDYKISYQVGTQCYPATNYDVGAPFICGKTMDFMILSCERGSDTDTTEVYLDIINETDLELNVAVINDDKDPGEQRIHINKEKGSITYYQ